MPAARSADAVELVGRAIEAHGGLDRWRRAARLDVELTVGGMAFVAKGRRKSAGKPLTASIEIETGEVMMRPFFEHGQWVGHYTTERLTITDKASGSTIDECETASRPRSTLRSLALWSDLDQLFFAGYALSHYYRLPFSLLDERIALGPVITTQGSDRSFTATFPPEVYSHSPQETFHFDATDRLVRHDYTARFLAPGARGAHLSTDYRAHDGLAFAGRRRVRLNAFGRAIMPTVLWLDVHHVAVVDH